MRKVVGTLLVVAVALAGVLSAVPASASVSPHDTGAFTMSPIVGVRTSGSDACSVGPTSGTNCPVTIVLTGTGLPTVDPSLVGLTESGANTRVAVVDNDDCSFFCGGRTGWKAGHDTDSVTTCDVIVGKSTSDTLIFQVGDLGALCPGYSINPGDKVQVILYNADDSVFASQTIDSAATPGPEPSVSDVNPPYGPVTGGTNAGPTGQVTLTVANGQAPLAVWFADPSNPLGATGAATNDFTPVDATHFSVTPPPSPASQDNEGVAVEVADGANGTSPQACAVLLPTGCQDEYMYLSAHSVSIGDPNGPPFNLNWSATLAGQTAADSHGCGINGSSGTSAGLTVSGSVTGGPLNLGANFGFSESRLAIPEALVGSATLTVPNPINISVGLNGTIGGCEQIPIPELSIPHVAGFYIVIGGSITIAATLTITIDAGTYTLTGGVVPGSNPDDLSLSDAHVVSNCVDGNNQPTTDCITTHLSASIQGTVVLSPLWFQVGPDEANVGAGLTAAATAIISTDTTGRPSGAAVHHAAPVAHFDNVELSGPKTGSKAARSGAQPQSMDADLCVGGNWAAQVNLGPLAANIQGNWLGPFNIVGDGSICPLGDAGGGSTVPDAPTGVGASPGDASATVSWSPPGSDGGSAITGYNVYKGTSAGGESATPVNASPLDAGATSLPVTGLTNGTTYFFTVTAINANGEGAASNEASATPSSSATVPGAPVGLSATGGNGSAGLTWSAPTSDGGSAITGYNVYKGTSAGGESPTPVNASPLAANATSFNATGLTNGTTYFFTVKAINAIGTGAASNETSATPTGGGATVPGAPTGVTATGGNHHVIVAWLPPTSDGGSAVTGYNVYKGTSAGGESPTPVNASPLSAATASFNSNALTNGTTYFFTVKAINAIGTGAASNEASATPVGTGPTVPGAPIGLKGAPGQPGKVKLTWSAPTSDGGSAITGYNVYLGTKPGGEAKTPLSGSPFTATTHAVIVFGLHNGTKYYFTVKAINAIGVGAASNEAFATPRTVPGAPVNVKATAGKGKVTVAWAPPASDGGSAITGYNVYEGTTAGGESNKPVNASPLSAAARSLVVTGLTKGKKYFFTVRAINAAGIGAASSEVTAKPTAIVGFAGVRLVDRTTRAY